MVYELTLSDNPKKAICHQESARVKAMGFCRKECLNTKQILTEAIALPSHQVGTANDGSINLNNVHKNVDTRQYNWTGGLREFHE